MENISQRKWGHNPKGRRARELQRRGEMKRWLPGQGKSLGQRELQRQQWLGPGPLINGQQLSGVVSQIMQSRHALNC